jgi:hypothetical protein
MNAVKVFVVFLEFAIIVAASVAFVGLLAMAYESLRRALFSGPAEGGEVLPPQKAAPPAGVLVMDGHWWKNTGTEDYSSQPAQFQQYARDVYVCQRCGAESKVFQNPPKIWDVIDIRTGRSITEQGLTTIDAHLGRHVAVQCKGGK